MGKTANKIIFPVNGESYTFGGPKWNIDSTPKSCPQRSQNAGPNFHQAKKLTCLLAEWKKPGVQTTRHGGFIITTILYLRIVIIQLGSPCLLIGATNSSEKPEGRFGPKEVQKGTGTHPSTSFALQAPCPKRRLDRAPR